MNLRHLVFVGGLAVVLSLAQGRAAAQAQPANAKAKSPSKTWTLPRTIDGQPDLQGVWANNNATPLERLKQLEGRATLTDAEVTAMRKKAAELYDGSGDTEFGDTYFETVWIAISNGEEGVHKKGRNGQDAVNGFDAGTGDYNSAWLAGRDWDNRTSLITDPPDGRMPPMTPEAKARQAASFAAYNHPPAGPEDRGLSERCITFGAPDLLAGYNSYYEIVQSANSVAIMKEKIHDVRVIPLDGSPHLPSNIQTWNGDARGHWEGDTLVVDSTNYKPGIFMNSSSEKLHVIERFSRTGPDTVQYQITIDDPATWTKPWSLMIPLRHTPDAIYEYACHEGNYAMIDMLAGARVEEKTAESEKRAPR